ncbi:MAG: hypothetical protein M1818_003244 [Claussenomyces sp. TS43310]|nr:MAG: hypothetical protein M1818_003244 [Claussenomyces sp. TS43310]
MASFISHSFLEADEQLAREIERGLNANPRRASALLSTKRTAAVLSTTARKKPRASKISFPLTPESLASPTNPTVDTVEDALSDISSEELGSLSPTPDSRADRSLQPRVTLRFVTTHQKLPRKKRLSVDTMSTLLSETPKVISMEEASQSTVSTDPVNQMTLMSRGGKRGPQGLTQVTLEEADMRSFPVPGPDLLAIVAMLKQEGSLPKVHDPSVLRLVDGDWMAPQMCAK